MIGLTPFLFMVIGFALQTPRLRGGGFHNLLVQRAAAVFEAQGFSVTPECPFQLPDGRTDFLDLLATRGSRLIACEVETTPRNALWNLEQAARLGLPLFVVVPNRTVLRAVQAQLVRLPRCADSPPIWILLPDQLLPQLAQSFPRFPLRVCTPGKRKNPSGKER